MGAGVDFGDIWTRSRARAEGLPRERLTNGRHFTRATHGAYLPHRVAGDLGARCAAVLEMCPHAVLSHFTALELRGLPVPPARRGELHLTVPASSSVPRRQGLIGHRAQRIDRCDVSGLASTGPISAWADVAALGASLDDLVAVADALWRRDQRTPVLMRELLDRRIGGRGTLLAKTAVGLMDHRAESAQESRLRVRLSVAGLAPPAVNYVVLDQQGRLVARVDLAWPEQRVAVEYDGEHHRSREQWGKDLRRRERLERQGWSVVVVVSADMANVPALLARITARLRVRQ